MEFDGHGEEWNPLFALSCQCGQSEFHVEGFQVEDPDGPLFLSPMAVRCTSCGKTTPLLDTDVHGYDAELGHGSSTRRAEGLPGRFRCGGCLGDRSSLFMRFEYTQDLFDGSLDDVAVAKEDLFTWVTAVGRCSSCHELNTIADFECA